MKKFLKILFIIISVILLALIILPFAFKGKITEQVKSAINENVNARVDFDNFGISFFRSFPAVSFRLKGLSVVGVNQFEGDTLTSISRLTASVDMMSLFGNDGYEIKTISIDKPRIMIKVLEGGAANWDITLPSEEVETETTTEEETPFQLALKKISVNEAYIVYDDLDLGFYMRLEDFNNTTSGDLTADFTSLALRNTSGLLWVVYEEIPYLARVHTTLTADLDMDLTNFAFTFRDNELQLNDLPIVFDGVFAMPESDMDLDFTFSSPKSEFKAFLSLLPALYAEDFAGLKAEGTLALDGFVKGTYSDSLMPGFGLNMEVANGMFQYPDLPSAVTDVFINANINNPGPDIDLTVVDVSRFSLKAAGNQVDMKLNLKTPVSDPEIDAFLKGKMDLGKVKDFYPLDEGATLSGIIESDMTAKGKMSSIENEQYDEFLFEGNLIVNNIVYKSTDFPDGIEITAADMNFSPQFARLNQFAVKMGESDISASGQIDNILGYALNDETIKGRFETRSAYFNLNPFLSDTEEEVAPEDTIPLTVIEVPANINFVLNSSFDKIIFDDLEISNARGQITVADQKISMRDLQMNMLGGTMALNGYYATEDIEKPEIDFAMQISDFDLQETFNTFNTFAMLAPIGKRASGNFSAGLNLTSLLGQDFSPVLNSLAGGGSLRSNALEIENSPALVNLADNLKMDMFKKIDVKDVNVNFAFKDGRVDVEPFDVNLGNSKTTLSGNHGFDQTINYLMSMEIPRSEFGNTANQVLDNLIGQAADRGININPSETVNVGVAFTGTVTDPRVRLNLAQSSTDARQQAMDIIEGAVNEIVGDVKDEAQEVIDDTRNQVNEELEQRAAKVVEEAKTQAANIRSEAASAAENVRKEARNQAKKLEDEASGPIAKAAARRAGEQLIKTADENAAKLEQEADQKASKLVREAEERAEKIRLGEE
jgi:hypothetical protein